MPYYAVHYGRETGIFNTWDECNTSVNKFSNAIYKKFNSKIDAELFVKYGTLNQKPIIKTSSYIHVYTDGCCINNGNKNAKAGIGIYFDINDYRNVSKRIIGSKQTNNIAELTAIIEVFSILESEINNKQNIIIHTDSDYSIKCFSTYGKKCESNNWTNNIPNVELVKTGYYLFENNPNIQLIHIKAHTNNSDIHSIGNMYADKLANESCK